MEGENTSSSKGIEQNNRSKNRRAEIFKDKVREVKTLLDV